MVIRSPRGLRVADYINDDLRHLNMPRCFKNGTHTNKYARLIANSLIEVYWCKECGAVKYADLPWEKFPKTVERIVKE
jgi:hypothetical protein